MSNNRAMVSLATTPEAPSPCAICGGPCESQQIEAKYPLFPTHPPVQRSHVVVAPYRIVDEEQEQVVYAPGQAMSNEDAIKYGVLKASEVEGKQAEYDQPEPPKRTRKRAVHAQQNRAVTPDQDRSTEVEEPDTAVEVAPEGKAVSRKGRPPKTAS